METTVAPVIEIKNLTKRYSESGPIVIDSLNLTIQPGEFVAIVGASGCGKSTLLNILSGLEKPSSGSVELNAKASLMFQESALLPWLTAGKNIELALKLSGYPPENRRARAQELLELVHLSHAYNQRPHELSGGMRQRVAIARAIAQDRKILLMDEPFSALDAITRDLLHDELIRIWEETGLAVLFVTHNVREAVRLGQRVILMSSKPGKIIRQWKIDFAQPRRIDSNDVAHFASAITDQLRQEIIRHA
ncbi:ABC transporter ATP-binding protein [Rhodoluna sp.]|uniref:ABC transporter ATP-binding protein n=1 Tax=Rhodoluna sp. TaxID=1969481 RepID=UPI0025CDF88B|nr:ABC transporter ATP-binding protein [Rhodoluna sp.]